MKTKKGAPVKTPFSADKEKPTSHMDSFPIVGIGASAGGLAFGKPPRPAVPTPKSENALKKSERFFRSTVDGLSAHIAVLDDQGEIILTNKSYRDFGERNGIDPSTVSEGSNYLAVCDTASGEHSEEAKPFAVGIREVLSGKRPAFALEYPCHSPDENRWFIGRVTPFSGEGPRRVVVAHENITERKRAEENLRKSEAKYRDLFDSNRDGIIRTELDGSIIEVNQMFLEITGYESFDDLKGSYQELTPEKWDELEADIVRNQVIERGYSDEYEKEYIHRNGTVFPIRIKVWLIKDNDQAVGMWGIVRDITERKLAEEALRKSESHFRTLVNTIPDLIWLKDADGVYLSCNKGFERFFGASEVDIVGKTDYDFVDKELADCFRENDRKAMAVGVSSSNEEQITFADDGHKAFLETIKTPMFDTDGTLIGILGIGRDITDRKRAEEALRESEERIRSVFASMTEMVVLHELVCNEDGRPVNYRMLDCNPAFTQITGIRRDDAVGRLSTDVYGSDTAPYLDEYARVALTGEPCAFIGAYAPMDKHFDIHAASPGKNMFVTVTTDITERKRAETYREMGRQILQILNEPGGLQESIQRILAALKTRTGVDAVGLRLQDGEDFPYFAQDGFSEDFLLTENTLVECGEDGGVCRDKDGNVNLECMCGNIIRGRYDSSLPFFSDNGTFWTNSTSELLASTSEEDRQARTRNRCNRDGYESVALIPVRTSGRIVGLIQLNDKRKGRFTPETIEILEGIAEHIGSALMRKGAERTLEEKIHDLGRSNKLMTGRELKMIELKEEINQLMEKLGLPPKYRS